MGCRPDMGLPAAIENFKNKLDKDWRSAACYTNNEVVRLVTVPVSEAICESFGSVMENYHRRFTHSDINDEQIQKEMFVCLVGPPPNTPAAEKFVKKVVDKVNFKHVLSEYSRFYKLGGKIMNRLNSEKYAYPFKF